jgi:endonuclease/exonuclease/phosphatase family metal-dependent hydrolase
MRVRLLIGVVVLGAMWFAWPERKELRVATFNIEYYPQTESQAQKAMDVIASLDAPVVALQEIRDKRHLEKTARARLGETWRFVGTDHAFSTGFLFDSAKVKLLSTTTYQETVVFPGAIPAFEARFDNGGGDPYRVMVIHLKAGGENFPTRKRQFDALEPILKEIRKTKEAFVLVGDFNATGADDRARIKELAYNADLIWASHHLKCTCFWQRELDCVGSPLDQMLTSVDWESIHVAGECAKGCPASDRCPAWRREVSDHCPVVLDL